MGTTLLFNNWIVYFYYITTSVQLTIMVCIMLYFHMYYIVFISKLDSIVKVVKDIVVKLVGLLLIINDYYSKDQEIIVWL